ncbi:MAG: hypothetical protein ACUZ77_12145 [Candidatus Brocadiales bacterium]
MHSADVYRIPALVAGDAIGLGFSAFSVTVMQVIVSFSGFLKPINQLVRAHAMKPIDVTFYLEDTPVALIYVENSQRSVPSSLWICNERCLGLSLR